MTSVVPRKYPKSLLHEFYQLHLGTPKFEIEPGPPPPAEPRFICKLTCPSVASSGGNEFPETVITAEGRSKKAAEHAAAEKALHLLKEKGLLPALKHKDVDQNELSYVSAEEVQRLQQKLNLLGAQVQLHGMAGSAGPSSSGIGTAALSSTLTLSSPLEEPPSQPVDVDSMGKEALQGKLREVLAENENLREELGKEHRRRMVAIEVLTGAIVV